MDHCVVDSAEGSWANTISVVPAETDRSNFHYTLSLPGNVDHCVVLITSKLLFLSSSRTTDAKLQQNR